MLEKIQLKKFGKPPTLHGQWRVGSRAIDQYRIVLIEVAFLQSRLQLEVGLLEIVDVHRFPVAVWSGIAFALLERMQQIKRQFQKKK